MGIQRLRTFLPYLTLLVLVALGLPAHSGAQPTCPPDGDVDQNGSVTAADALLVFQQALGLAQLNTCQRSIADVFPQPSDPDGSITASDALCIFQKALGLPSCLDTLPSSNQPPVVDAGPDQSVDAGVMVFLSGTASDPDGTIASYAWTQTDGTAVSLTGSDAATAVFVAPEVSAAETLTFRLTVTDDAGAQTSDEMRVTVRPAMGPVDDTSAAEVFGQHISGPIVQTKCVTCHVANGASGNTRLVFVRAADTPDHEALNLQTFEDFLAKVADEGGGSYVLNKIQGVGHGGGVQVSPGTDDFANMQRFLGLLGEEVTPPAPVTVETLFDTVIMASPRKALRRAAMIFAGRIPTDAEYAAVEGGDESVLRATIRGLMEGPQFHEFLIRASNDRLLTDRSPAGGFLEPEDAIFLDYVNEKYRLRKAAHASGDERQLHEWEDRVSYGVHQAPLESIAHVVLNDLPYTEVLTADYVMANAWAAAAYGASTQFDNPTDPYEFKPSEIVSYYRPPEGGPEGECDPVINFCRVIDPGPLGTDYPHAGVLNTLAFLQRYPTTATNRNRARSRWTYYHFLGVDVEKSASRTTDPLALADTNNPTMHNPSCTVCHSVLDPVAGAFQNYDERGFYRSRVGGQDSLDEFYKNDPRDSLSIQAESWEEREVLTWPLSFSAGIETLRVMFTNPFNDGRIDRRINLDRLDVTDGQGGLLLSQEFEDLEPPVAHWGKCGQAEYSPAAGRRGHLSLWGGYHECAIFMDVEVPASGVYNVEIVGWSNGWFDQPGTDGFAKLSVLADGYEYGDTWYNDMRAPGFDGDSAPDSDHSVQWLARQIVADPRFAEATVKFWWPAIMGSEVAEFPEETGDADFEGRLVAANAQDAELARLAEGFQRGFPDSPYTYNLKDLLVEIVLSKWFRADAVTVAEPVRHVALHDVGARRLLTPEELARKTAGITGVQWGRYVPGLCCNQWNRSRLTDDFLLLYGGIDSDGIIERARDLTSVMAGVAKLHAAEVSCPIVMRELYLLPDSDRLLFSGIDTQVAPSSELSTTFEIHAEEEPEVFSFSGPLTTGPKTMRLTFINGHDGRHVRIDRLEVRSATGLGIESRELEELGPAGSCNFPVHDHFAFHCPGSVAVPIEVPTAGIYVIEVVARADHAGSELPMLAIAVESETAAGPDAGADSIRSKLVELYDKLLGVQVKPDSPDVDAALQLFLDVIEQRRESHEGYFDLWSCDWDASDIFFFKGILENVVVQYENEYGRWYGFDRDRVDAFMRSVDFSDPYHTAQAWVVVLAAMMMDYRYLYLN